MKTEAETSMEMSKEPKHPKIGVSLFFLKISFRTSSSNVTATNVTNE